MIFCFLKIDDFLLRFVTFWDFFVFLFLVGEFPFRMKTLPWNFWFFFSWEFFLFGPEVHMNLILRLSHILKWRLSNYSQTTTAEVNCSDEFQRFQFLSHWLTMTIENLYHCMVEDQWSFLFSSVLTPETFLFPLEENFNQEYARSELCLIYFQKYSQHPPKHLFFKQFFRRHLCWKFCCICLLWVTFGCWIICSLDSPLSAQSLGQWKILFSCFLAFFVEFFINGCYRLFWYVKWDFIFYPSS